MNVDYFLSTLADPGKGIHSSRLCGLASFDTIGTVITAYGISRYYSYNFPETLAVLFLTGESLHLLFGIDTAFIKIIKGLTI